MFKFDFKLQPNDFDENPLFDSSCQQNESDEEITIACYDSKQVVVTKDILDNIDVYRANSLAVQAGEVIINFIKSGYLMHTFDKETSKDIRQAEQNHLDLIPGVYEGGAKIWECTDDLIQYMSVNYPPEKFDGKRVLDLGCGAGILGIYAYACGAVVHFQDYNQDVLEKITIPNVMLNFPEKKTDGEQNEKEWKRVKFYSGDWGKYTDLTKGDPPFDYILTSETIYNESNHQKLINTMFAKLKPDGIVLLAAKTHYFGVGGGLRLFEDLIQEDNRFESLVVWSACEGISREILILIRVKENNKEVK